MRAVTFASMRMYARRYVAAGVAVVMGVGFVVAATSMGSAARNGVRASVGEQYAAADVVMATSGRRDARSVAALGSDDGVAASATGWSTYLPETDDPGAVVRLGSLATAADLRWQQALEGRLPSAPDEVAVTTTYAERSGLQVGDPLPARLGGRILTVTGVVAGAVSSVAVDAYAPEAVLATSRTAYPEETVLLALPGTETAELVSELRRALPGVSVMAASAYVDEISTSLTGDIDVVSNLVLGFALVATFVAAMVVGNTFTIVLAQRARDVALLRCVGAQRGQLIRSVVAEAAVMGLVTAAVGALVGVGLGAAAVGLLGDRFEGVPLASPDVAPAGLLLPWLAGGLVTVLSAVVPAVRATRVEPMAALQMDDRMDLRTVAGRLRLLASVVAVAVGLGALVIGATGVLASVELSLLMGIAGGVLSFLGVLWAGPVIVPAAVRALSVPARAAGVPGRLALANSGRNPKRTAATAMALLVGVTLISMLTVGTASSQATAQRLNDENLPIDVSVSSTRGLDAGDAQRLLGVEGIDEGAVLWGTQARVDGSQVRVAGVDAAAVADVVRGGTDPVPRDDELLLPNNALYSLGLEPGEEVDVSTGAATVVLSVRGGDSWGESLLVSAPTLQRLAGQAITPEAVWLRVSDEDPSGTLSDVEAIVAEGDALLGGGLETRLQLDRMLSVLLAVAAGLLAVAVLIALVGVGNTLTLSVLERTRENALLRALGLTRAQMRSMLAVEAVLLTAVAAALGVGLGAGYAWFGVKTLLGPDYGADIVFDLPLGHLTLVVAVAVGAGLAASWLPARRAARSSPVAAL